MVKKLTYFYLSPFLSCPNGKLHLKFLSRLLYINHTTLRLLLNEFEKKGILKKENKGRLTNYYLDFKNPLIYDYLLLAETEKLIYLSEKWILFKEIVSYFKDTEFAILFGSSVENFKKANDVDLVYAGELNKNNNLSKYNLKLHLVKINDINEITETLKQEIMKKHIIIKGKEKIIKWLY